jgi:allophanate hydrolase
VAAGESPHDLLHQCRAAARASAQQGIWIHLCDEPAWQAQLSLLGERLGHEHAARRYPLLGLPFAVKDNIDVAGAPTTAACPAFAYVPQRSATVVQKLLDAGALWLGKSNLDQFATGLVGTRSPYGRPASVADATRISGGSSSGSAVALALGQVVFALGTDTAGSGRVPAGFNGLVGLKPTPGRISTAGVVPACRSIDCVSLLAHSVEDAAELLALTEGADPLDAYSQLRPGPARFAHKLRIGVPRAAESFGDAGYDAAWGRALERAAAMGHTLVELDFAPLHAVADLLYAGPWVAERHSTVRTLLHEQPEAMDPQVREVISRALHISATQTFEAMYRLREWQAQLASLWRQVDVLMVPTAPGHPTFAQLDADPLGINTLLGRYTNFVNLLGWSALALPAGHTAVGLPFSVTFIAQATHDVALLDLGCRWQGRDEPAAARAMPHSEATLPLVVVGAHLQGLPLNHQLVERGATLRERTRTAPLYRLVALPGTTPPKPGLVRVDVPATGSAIEVEVWDMPTQHLGSFLAGIPAPLCLGSVELADGHGAHGFLCEGHAAAAARDISHFGGWRAYLQSLKETWLCHFS